MAEKRYNVIFNGEIEKGRNIDDVKKNLLAVAKISEKQVNHLFSEPCVIVKKGADENTASKYKAIFKKAGAI